MIRLCDQKMDCIEIGSLNREQILDYFSSGHENDVLCVYADAGKKEYIGIITERLIKTCDEPGDAILTDYVILNEDVWLNARSYFSHYSYWSGEHVLLPILNEERNLVCFAYEDAEANREIRMLRELLAMPGVLQFKDIYPEYKCVKMYGFNELAYFFAKYLEHMNIAVKVSGEIWSGFFVSDKSERLSCECLTIYAEGIKEKKRNWAENLLRSVSVEFECIDKIYEANIKEGRITDAQGEIIDLLARLKNEKEIIIYGTGYREQDAYDYLLGNGIEACCFIGKSKEECMHRLFGKKVISGLEARNAYKNAIFIDCSSQNSAWGMGKVDYYDYIGYRRNERYILLRDYVNIRGNCLLNVIRNNKIDSF